MIEVIYRGGSRAKFHVGVADGAGLNPDRRTICGRWLRGARTAMMDDRDWFGLGDRRCRHCRRARRR